LAGWLVGDVVIRLLILMLNIAVVPNAFASTIAFAQNNDNWLSKDNQRQKRLRENTHLTQTYIKHGSCMERGRFDVHPRRLEHHKTRANQ
jgi:hypothetical protein